MEEDSSFSLAMIYRFGHRNKFSFPTRPPGLPDTPEALYSGSPVNSILVVRAFFSVNQFECSVLVH